MRKTTITALMLVAALIVSAPLFAGQKSGCTTIQQGLVDSQGRPLATGYDAWGYNYQAMMFNGYYDNFTRPAEPVSEGDSLMMKWNAAWLSNTDCDGDGKVDRHFGYPSYIGSGAWLTNHERGTYVDDSTGRTCHWTYFVKIVAAPADATIAGGEWKTSSGITIGPVLWNDFAVVQEVWNDDCAGEHGIFYKSPASPGLGAYKP